MKITFVDTETTGLDANLHEVIEFGALQTEYVDGKFNVLNKHSFKIKPQRIQDADKEALRVNGYKPEDWTEAFEQGKIAPKIRKIMTECDLLVGQRLYFDLRMIQKMLDNNKIKVFYPKYMDTKQIAEELQEQNTSLEYLCKKYNILYEGRAHTALTDCEITLKVFEFLKNKLGKDPQIFTFTNPYVPVKRSV